MAEISAAAVKSLRDKTNLPMMKCKQALQETGGDEQAAIEYLRKEGEKFAVSRGERETSAGRIEVYASLKPGVGAMVELLCESDPVTKNDGFRKLAADLAKQLATGPGASDPEKLLDQPSPSGGTLRTQLNDLQNQIREVFKVKRIVRIDAPCGGYAHHNGAAAVLVQAEGGNAEAAKDVAMHVVAMRPAALAVADLDPALVAKEREILTEAARKEGKPENIIGKMVEGRLRNFYAEKVLLEQPFVKNDKETVGQMAKAAGMKVQKFVHWELGGA
jgi:elongation factor Ts